MTLQDVRKDAHLPAQHQAYRMRHELRRRTLTVTSVTAITPKMLRIDFTSPDLADFNSGAPDDHVKLLFGMLDSGRPLMRDYTPRRFDPQAQTLTLDFAIHEAGPATAWALAAKPGDELQIGGPRGSSVVPDDFDWYLLVCDETGLPALGRRLEELRPGVPVISVALVDSREEIQAIETPTEWQANWVLRDETTGADADRLLTAVRSLTLPPGEGYIWIAAEAASARAVRTHVLDEREHPAQWMRASGYWRRGAEGVHDHLD